MNKLLAVCILILSLGVLTSGQRKPEKPYPPVWRSQSKSEKQLPPRWDSPPEVTILKHEFGISKKFVSETSPNPSIPSGEPSSSLRNRANPAVYLKVKNQAPKKIVSMVWYFVLQKTADEEYFRVRFVDTAIIEAGKTRTLTGEMDRIPRHPQTVSVDELNTPRPPAQERIVISCIMFEDGSFSALSESTKEDCESLKTIPKSKSR